jgi:ATP-dependent Clp protease protease subunit
MTEFEKYVKSDYGVNSTTLYDYKNSMTPMVIEEREMRAVSMSVFDRLMMERIIWCAGPVNDRMSIIVQAQLMFLNSLSHEDITIHVDTPGGSVKSGLGIVDVMEYIDCDIATVNTGMAASMGSILLGAGTKGKRSSLRFSKTMLHQSSGGAIGNIQDARITMNEWEKTNDILFELLGDYCDKDPKQVMEDATRDNWLTAQEALDYGIIDEVIGLK